MPLVDVLLELREPPHVRGKVEPAAWGHGTQARPQKVVSIGNVVDNRVGEHQIEVSPNW